MNIRDIAKKAGVSYMTISRVINGSSLVNEQTRKKVESIIADVKYIPYRSATTIRQKTSNIIGLVMPRLEYAFFEPFINELCFAAQRTNLSVEIYFTNFNLTAEENCVHELAARRARGIIIVSAQVQDAALLKIREYVRNILFLGLPYPNIRSEVRYSYVGFEEDAVCRIAAEKLSACGHRNVLYVSSPHGSYKSANMQMLRRNKFEEHCRRLGMRITDSIELNNDDYEESISAEKFSTAVRKGPCTAAFCENDFAAMKVYRAVYETGMRIPADISVIGIDDLFCSKYFTPPLSTVALPYEKTVEEIVTFFCKNGKRQLKKYYTPQFRNRGSIHSIA